VELVLDVVLLAIREVDEDVLVVVLLVVVELDVVVLLVVVEEVDELVELLDEELLELEVVLVASVYMNVVVPTAVPPGPPQVALIVYVPVVHDAVPPGTDVWLKSPVVPLTEAKRRSTWAPRGLSIVMTAAVFAPGAGETTPVMTIGVVPEYVGWAVCTVTV
jgi:hypothetical protein